MRAKLVVFPPLVTQLETPTFLISPAKTSLHHVSLKGMFQYRCSRMTTNINSFTLKGIVAFAFSTLMGIFGIYTVASYGMKKEKKTPERAPLLAEEELPEQ
jgi:hypothetical protein